MPSHFPHYFSADYCWARLPSLYFSLYYPDSTLNQLGRTPSIQTGGVVIGSGIIDIKAGYNHTKLQWTVELIQITRT